MCLPARLGAVRSCKVWVQILNKPRAMVAVAAMHVKCVERHQCPGQEGGSLSARLANIFCASFPSRRHPRPRDRHACFCWEACLGSHCRPAVQRTAFCAPMRTVSRVLKREQKGTLDGHRTPTSLCLFVQRERKCLR
eukprot:1159226-Pelagomonas_calceolata.AAC.2